MAFEAVNARFFLTLNGCPNSKIGPLSIFIKIQDEDLNLTAFLKKSILNKNDFNAFHC
jgi:hypothetical protein